MATNDMALRTRAPAVAGQFYPRDPDRLRATVDQLLDGAAAGRDTPKALIAPHAGYAYSGPVAAAAFAQLRDRTDALKRVIVIGPAHYVPFEGVAIPNADAFATPLGRVPLSRDALESLADLPFVRRSDAPHAPEHALEVELPFLQRVLEEFELVPLVVGDADPAEVAETLRRLWGGPETLIVVSSDLSHFHDYDTARRLDAATAAKIEAGQWAEIGPRDACGCLAVSGLLIEAERRGLKARRLALYNSGDTAGSRDRVVGYGAWAFCGGGGSSALCRSSAFHAIERYKGARAARHRRRAMNLFTLLGAFSLVLIIGGLFGAGFLAWNNDRIREGEGHSGHRPH